MPTALTNIDACSFESNRSGTLYYPPAFSAVGGSTGTDTGRLGGVTQSFYSFGSNNDNNTLKYTFPTQAIFSWWTKRQHVAAGGEVIWWGATANSTKTLALVLSENNSGSMGTTLQLCLDTQSNNFANVLATVTLPFTLPFNQFFNIAGYWDISNLAAVTLYFEVNGYPITYTGAASGLVTPTAINSQYQAASGQTWLDDIFIGTCNGTPTLSLMQYVNGQYHLPNGAGDESIWQAIAGAATALAGLLGTSGAIGAQNVPAESSFTLPGVPALVGSANGFFGSVLYALNIKKTAPVTPAARYFRMGLRQSAANTASSAAALLATSSNQNVAGNVLPVPAGTFTTVAGMQIYINAASS